ncbi:MULTISPECIES: three-helix bundle dimerization domain-containing protein [unclassified Amycolatopsis]|uniref:three-helix bundle dimerization domain-containing protein n=1 Tax=unclassified Amycolatopsis TaxID=2618356 RepID=UPI0012A9B53C|nr:MULTISPECIES: hypothetical protein [unclassified Amycolatopsis]QFU93031.1 hypothetical protein YIM_39395 [Amycolatopsis sp. YIM 10]
MDDLHGEQLSEQLRALEERLARDYADVPPRTVHRCVEQEVGRFAGARVLSFIPVLVERAVRPKLERGFVGT